MSEMLSETEVDAIAMCGVGWLSEQSLDRLIVSHRALQAERDALKAELAAAKATIWNFPNVEQQRKDQS